jgi:SprB repeat/Secretion system C-terminal sorting domain
MKQQLRCKPIFLLVLLFALFISKDATAQTLTININSTNVSCNGTNDGTASAIVSGGTAPYTYLWTNNSSSSGTATIIAQKDNSIFEESTGNSNGAGEYFIAGTTAAFFKHRALISFDITQFIPTGSVITSAQLSLHLSQTSSSAGPQSHSLYKLLQDWGEGSSNAGGSPGRGAPAGINDATWVNTFFPSSNWTNAGATFNISESGAAIVDAPGFYNWSSPVMVADIQAWLDAPFSNFGWLMKSNETTSSQAKRYDSKENATLANRPVLTVGYVSNVVGTASSISNLVPGIYTVMVTDAMGSTASESLTISEPAALSPIITDSSVCGSYIWPVNGETYTSSADDTVIIGCQSYILHLVVSNITVNVSSGSILCNGGTTSAIINASGGTAPYRYSINGRRQQPNNTFNNIKAGNYIIVVTDLSGCTGSFQFTITQPPKLKLIVVSKIKPTCIGGSNGSLQVSASGGTTPYQFSINGGPYTSNSTFTNLAAGIYNIGVKDTNACATSQSVNLGDGKVACAGILASVNNDPNNSATGKSKNILIDVLPNPSNTFFTLNFQKQSNTLIQIVVTDIVGRTVYQTKGRNSYYRFGETFTKGVYFVKVIQGNYIQTKKVIKQ